jgi:hypothetical protein
LYSTSALFKIISLKINDQDKADVMGRECCTHGREEGILVGEPEGKRPGAGRWENYIKIDLR